MIKKSKEDESKAKAQAEQAKEAAPVQTEAGTKPKGQPGGGEHSFSAKLMRQMAEKAPVAFTEVDTAGLPVIDFPNVGGMEIRVPALPLVSPESVMERFELVYYDTCVERSPRAPGEPVQLGDEILIDMVCYAGGKIVPFNAHENLRLRLESNSIRPGLGDALVGTPVGDTKLIPLTIPVEDVFGAKTDGKIVFVVDVKAAASLTFPKSDAPETLKKIGLGKTLDDTYGYIARELGEERAGLMLSKGVNMTLDAIADRVVTPVDEALVDAEIRAQWSKAEGRFLTDKGLSRQDLDDALEGWLRDAETRETARQRLKITMAILAYARQETDDITPEEVEAFFEGYAADNGIDLKKWRAALQSNPEQQAALLNQYLHMRTLFHMVAQVPVHYEGMSVAAE